jgi:hypothetical protein
MDKIAFERDHSDFRQSQQKFEHEYCIVAGIGLSYCTLQYTKQSQIESLHCVGPAMGQIKVRAYSKD